MATLEEKKDFFPGLLEILGMSIPAASAVSKGVKGVMDVGGDVFPLISELGIGAGGLDNPEQRAFLANTINQGGLQGGINPDATAATQNVIPDLVGEFHNLLNSLPAPDRSVVMERMGGMTPQGRMEYMQHVIQNGFGYGTINEGTSTGELTPGYGDTSSIQNLGFSNQLASNDYYNPDLGIFLPSSYESGYTAGSTGDDRYRQNYMRDRRNKYRTQYRYGMGGKVRDLDFT